MNNRKWLETLSDEEFIEFCMKYFWAREEESKNTSPCVVAQVKDMAKKMLQAEHTTTADEDFAEIDMLPFAKSPEYITYKHSSSSRFVRIYSKESWYGGNEWCNEQIDVVRPIADKKRKEVWDK